MNPHDQQAILEFDTITLAQAQERLHTGRWSQAAYEAYLHLWKQGHGQPTDEVFPDTADIIRAHQEHTRETATKPTQREPGAPRSIASAFRGP